MMNVRFLSLVSLAWLMPLAVHAAAERAFLLKADAIQVQADKRVVATGRAALVSQAGTRYTAEQIVVDQAGETATLLGGVNIQTPDGSTAWTKELTVDVKGQRIMTLSAGKVSVVNETPSTIPASTALEFTSEFPKSEVNLRKVEIRR